MALGRGAAKQRKEGVKTVCVQKSQDWQGSSSSNCKAFRSSSLFIYSKFLSPIFSSGAQRDEEHEKILELPNFALIDHPTLDSQIFLEKWFHSNFQNIFCIYLTLDTYLKLFFAPRRRRANGLLQRIFALPWTPRKKNSLRHTANDHFLFISFST